MKFNINHDVKVKLTDIGRSVLKENWSSLHKEFPASFKKYTPKKEDSEGWSTWQLWTLMGAFGHCMHNGTNVPFETEIEIIENQ